MHLSRIAVEQPHKPAAVFLPSWRTLTFRELDDAANKAANALRSLGAGRGDCVVLCIENCPQLLALAFGAQRIGLYYVLASTKAAAAELKYIVEDSAANVAVVSAATEAWAGMGVLADLDARVFTLGAEATSPGEAWELQFDAAPASLPADPSCGREMLYTSGTTGRPKGVRKPLLETPFDAVDSRNAAVALTSRLTPHSVYLSTSPLYHSAPNRYLSAAVHMGATSVILERFDAELALLATECHRCTHSLWVPTMFHRLLRLPEAIRCRYRLDSMQVAVHGAAPCPVHVKRQMLEWWGPIIDEYYSGTEGIGATFITAREWLEHPGSVGRAYDGVVHILDEAYAEVARGTIGKVYFDSDATFEYWQAPAKTVSMRSPQGWRSFGDIGWVDAEGYLYLTDREAFTIVSGGVNIYPQEIEDALLQDPRVMDAAVIGLPNEEYGEEVRAVVQLADARDATQAVIAELKERCRAALGAVKVPRQIDFTDALPRHPTGKLHKRVLIDRYRLATITSTSNP
jgi:long-chain acyl-CoA synthetase